MNRAMHGAVAGTALLSFLSGSAQAAESYWDWKSEFQQIVAGGKVSLDARYRLETVDQDNALDEATAATIRTRLGYLTGPYKGLQAFVELEDVSEADSDDYFDGNPPNTDMVSAVVDPDGTEVNQYFLRYSGIPKNVFQAGRQRLVLDNHRFIGDVGWRQNQQTYDGYSFVNTNLPRTTATYAYLYNANTIFGEDNPIRGDIDMNSHILNVNFKAFPWLGATGYAYLLDFNGDPPASNKNPNELNSTQTYGVRALGEAPLGNFKFLYTAEYANQSDYEDGSPAIDADYFFFEPGVTAFGVTAKLGYELLGGNDNDVTPIGFATPLATLHAFQGWADVFLVTPGTGIEDVYGSLGYQILGTKLLAMYHEYSADDGNGDLGSEINLQATYTFLKYYTAGVKYADYSADDAFVSGTGALVDTEKFWLWLEMKI